MRPRRTWASNKVYEMPGGNEDQSLWVEVLQVEDVTLGPQVGIRSVYTLSDEERQRVLSGANISLTILATEQPPVFMEVTEERLGKSPFRRWRDDGWPYCPVCDEDELYSLGDPAMPQTIVGCYNCHWKPPPR